MGMWDIPFKGLQYIAYSVRDVIFDETVCLARLSNVNDDARDVRKFLHRRSPFFFVLFNFLFNIPSLTLETYRDNDPNVPLASGALEG
jgi:hypothetical protein